MSAFKPKSVYEVVLGYLIPEAAAAVVGLEPIAGATVDLIRVDNTGLQVGDILATTTTSVTGDYMLTLPADVSLAGNLVVRIVGANDLQMRAQVVEETVDITPVSEFVLQKFIAEDTDLAALVIDAVVKLSGKVEAFDITAGNDISAMLAQLETEVGAYIESEIDLIESVPATAVDLSGDYRSATIQLSLHDGDNSGYGSFAVDLWSSEFTFTGDANGNIDILFKGEESAWSTVSGVDGNSTMLTYEVEIDQSTDTFPGTFSDGGVLNVAGKFEEDIGDDYGWRWPPVNYRLQKVSDRDIFFQISQEAAVRYEIVDTNDDGIKDAIDPAARSGDEVFRGLEVFYKQPTAMTDADLMGTFGRVYMGAFLHNSAHIEIEVENSEVTFAGNGTLDIGNAQQTRMSRSTDGVVSVASIVTDEAATGVAISVDENGDLLSIGGEPADGFVNDTFDLIVFAESDGVDQMESQFSSTLLVKLPSSAPSVAGKQYRLMFLDVNFSGQSFGITHSAFDSYIHLTSESTGTLTLKGSEIYKDSLSANVEIEVFPQDVMDVVADVGANGATTLTVNDGEGYFTLTGFLNQTGSYGVFKTAYRMAGENEPDTIGMAILVEVE